MSEFRLVPDKNLTKIERRYFGKVPLNERELELFEKNLLTGLFRPQLQGKHKIVYTAPLSRQLSEYTKKGLTVHKLYSVFAQIVEITKKIDKYGLYLHNLVLDERLIYVREMTGELIFLYEPVVSRENSANVYAFLADWISGLKRESEEVQTECGRIKTFFAEPGHYRIEDIEKFITEVYPQIYQQITRVEKESRGKSGFIASSRLSYQEHCAECGNTGNAGNRKNAAGEMETTLLCEEDAGTALLEDEEGGTVLLAESGPSARLCRLRNSDTIEISGQEFHIGKNSRCEYCIDDNKSISRNHAVILRRGNSYILCDENSTNHSYLNGIMLKAGEEEELRDKDVIRLADEDFQFYLG